MLDRILSETMQGFGSVPKRGAEVGGLLLGTISPGEPAVVSVQGFEPVFTEHARGPSYLLSANDEERLTAAIARRKEGTNEPGIVGFFRSHTRDRLGLTEEDVEMFNRYFPGPEQIFLLVKPYAARACVGGFFFREEGHIRAETSYLEFPFRRKDLGGGAPVPERSVSAEETAENDLPPRRTTSLSLFGETSPYEPITPIASPKPKRNVWIPLSFIFLLVGIVLGFQTAITLRPSAPAAPAGDPYRLSLSASKTDSEIHLNWNRRSPVIAKARGGRLAITDGTHNQIIDLDVGQLQNGTVVYRYLSGKVGFRLEVFAQNQTIIAESAEVYTGTAAASPDEARPLTER